MPHLTHGELAGYLDNDLPAGEQRRVVAHLDACETCRSEAIETARLLRQNWDQLPAVRGRRRLWRWGLPAGVAGVAAAAALAGILLVQPDVIDRGGEGAMQERFSSEGVALLAAYNPPAGASIRRADLRFAWADGGTESYRITVTAEDGRLVWSQALADTTIVPPTSIDLEAGERFFWYVDAISAGVVARTGAQSFVVTP